jgi:arsenate reductase
VLHAGRLKAPSLRNVLFLCTGNSARSILAEALLNANASGRFRAFSAGSRPAGRVHPFALALLEERGIATTGLRSKSWDEFAAPGAPGLDYVLTVCDNAAGETCPYWPGHPATAHWGIPDPAAIEGSDDEKRRAFRAAFERLSARIGAFLRLPLETLGPDAAVQRLREIGRLP